MRLPVEQVRIDRNHGHHNLTLEDTDEEGRRLLQRAFSCEVGPGEALFIPHAVPHAVISTPDPTGGAGLAINLWLDRPV